MLDVGCGKGELAHDLVVRAGAERGRDRQRPHHLAFARSRFRHERLRFVDGRRRRADLPGERFDVDRALERARARRGPRRPAARARRLGAAAGRPASACRCWPATGRSRCARELGLDYFSDPGHDVEYDEAGLRDELEAAGLRVTELRARLGRDLGGGGAGDGRSPGARGRCGRAGVPLGAAAGVDGAAGAGAAGLLRLGPVPGPGEPAAGGTGEAAEARRALAEPAGGLHAPLPRLACTSARRAGRCSGPPAAGARRSSSTRTVSATRAGRATGPRR